MARAPPGPRATGRARFPDRYYLEVQRAGHGDDNALVAATARLACDLALPVVATHPVQFLRPRRFPRARSARLHRRRRRARRRAAAAEIHAGPIFQDAGRNGDARSRTCPRRSPTRWRSRMRCNLTIPLGKQLPARLSDAGRRHARPASEARGGGRSRAASRGALSGSRGARAEAARIRRATRFRDQHHRADGIRRLFPHRRRFHQLGEEQWRAGGSGPRLRRRIARRLFARHHRPRSAALRAAVRALPQSRARVDAGLRHRLLPGRPRPRHRLREGEVRRGFGVADRDVRHDGRESRGPRRRPRPRPRIQLLRRHRQADSVPARQAHHAEAGAGDGAAARRAREERGGSARAARARRSAGRPDAQRRHARGRRADRARASSPISARSTRRPAPAAQSPSSTRTTSKRWASSSSTSWA